MFTETYIKYTIGDENGPFYGNSDPEFIFISKEEADDELNYQIDEHNKNPRHFFTCPDRVWKITITKEYTNV